VSRVGRAPITIPEGVKCEFKAGVFKVSGPKGELECTLRPEIKVEIEDSTISFTRPDDKPQTRAYHGLTRALVNNLIVGVTEGYSRELAVEGVGYRASIQGKNLNLQAGFSHPVSVEPPEGITFEVEGQNLIRVSGIDKQKVGQVAADIRALRPPEPYKGKGIRYRDEQIRRKVGKAGTK